MSRRRAPRGVYQRLQDGTKAQRVGGAGLLYNAAPIPEHTLAVAAAAASSATVSDRGSKIDRYTLASGGAQDLALTYLPLTESWNVTLNGVGGLWETDYEIDGQTLSLLTPFGALTGDKVQIQYDYLVGQPEGSTDALYDLNVPYGSSGWKYKNHYTGDNTYAATTYDDGSWALGEGVLYQTGMELIETYTSPFSTLGVPGSQAGLGTNVGNPQAPHGPFNATNGEFWVRRWFPPGTGIEIKFDVNNYMEYFIDGVSTGGSSTGSRRVGKTTPPFDKGSTWLLAVHSWAGNGQVPSALDVEVTGTVT